LASNKRNQTWSSLFKKKAWQCCSIWPQWSAHARQAKVFIYIPQWQVRRPYKGEGQMLRWL
jgi:hypothetical protein